MEEKDDKKSFYDVVHKTLIGVIRATHYIA